MITTEKELRKLIQKQNEKLEQLIQSLKEANSQTGTQSPDSP
jgi:uncharacterized coiled-coil protein SlyX